MKTNKKDARSATAYDVDHGIWSYIDQGTVKAISRDTMLTVWLACNHPNDLPNFWRIPME